MCSVTIEDRIRLTYEQTGDERLSKLSSLLAESRAEAKALGQVFRQTGGDAQQFIADSKRLAIEQEQVKAAMRATQAEVRAAKEEAKQAAREEAQAIREAKAIEREERKRAADAAKQAAADTAAANRAVAASSREAGQEAGRSAQGMFQLAAVMDDMQYVGSQGLRPVLNNIAFVMPQVAIGVIAAQAAFSGLKLAVNAVTGAMAATPLDTTAGSVAALTKRVDELNASYLKTTDTVKELNQAEKDLKAAREADAAKNTTSSDQDARAKAFAGAAKQGGGNAVESVVRQVVNDRFAADGVSMVMAAIQSGRISPELAQGLGLTDAKSVERFLDSGDPLNRKTVRDKVVGGQTNELIAGMAGGQATAFQDFRGMLSDSRLGQRFPSGQFRNPIVQGLVGPDVSLRAGGGGGISDPASLVMAGVQAAQLAVDAKKTADEAKQAKKEGEVSGRVEAETARQVAEVFRAEFGGSIEGQLRGGGDPMAIGEAIVNALMQRGLSPQMADKQAQEMMSGSIGNIQVQDARARGDARAAMEASGAGLGAMEAAAQFGEASVQFGNAAVQRFGVLENRIQRSLRQLQQQQRAMGGNDQPPPPTALNRSMR